MNWIFSEVHRVHLGLKWHHGGSFGDEQIERLGRSQPYLIGGGLVQCSCATASVHAELGCSNISQVSASLPASIR
jgi:hypothetical protein